jgi:hypothetical protein
VVGEVVAACSKCSLDCSSALLGMQPTLVQVPPGAGPPLAFFHSSMQAVEAQLRGADGGDVAARAAADDDDVEFLDMIVLVVRRVTLRAIRRRSLAAARRRSTAAGRAAGRCRRRRASATRISRQIHGSTPVTGHAAAHAADPAVAAAAAQPVDDRRPSMMGGSPAQQPRLGALELVRRTARRAGAASSSRRVRRPWLMRDLPGLRCRTAGAPGLPALPSSSPGPARPRGRR